MDNNRKKSEESESQKINNSKNQQAVSSDTTQNKIEIKEGKKTAIKEKIFPGYLLINMILDDATWLAVRTTPGITGFVGTSTKPTPLPDDEVATIKRFMQLEAPKFKTASSTGEAVKITDGPFTASPVEKAVLNLGASSCINLLIVATSSSGRGVGLVDVPTKPVIPGVVLTASQVASSKIMLI